MTNVFVLPRGNDSSKKVTKSSLFSFSRKHLVWLLVVAAVLLLVFLLLKKTVRSPGSYISSIQYSESARKIVPDQDFYDHLTTQLYGKNIYDLRYVQLSALEHEIRQKYPFFGTIKFTNFIDGKLIADLTFREPSYVVKNIDQQYAIYGDFFHLLSSGGNLGKNALTLYLPEYLSGTTALSGMYFTMSSSYMEEILPKIQESFPGHSKIVYLLGGERLAVFVDNKKIYVNLYADIDEQIRKFTVLKSAYAGYNDLTEIDLGSLESIIVR